MAPVQLPPPVLNNVINLPPQPQDPLRDQDVIESIRMVKGTRVAFEEGKVTARDLVNVEVFGHNVIQTKAGIPVSLRDSMRDAITDVLEERLEQITRTLDELKDDVRGLREDVKDLKADIGLVARTTALTHNRGSAEGVVRQFIEVPFSNGQWPTRLENPLPLLNSRATVQALSSQVANRYHQKYFPNVPVPRDLDVRKKAILTAIGCLPLVL